MADLTSRVTTVVAAPADRVYAAWTDPELLSGWFWPFPATFEVAVYLDGTFHFGSSVIGVSGRFLEIDAPNGLVYTWIWDGESAETRVTVEFRPTSAGTEIALEHSGNADAETGDNHTQGLDRLYFSVRAISASVRGWVNSALHLVINVLEMHRAGAHCVTRITNRPLRGVEHGRPASPAKRVRLE